MAHSMAATGGYMHCRAVRRTLHKVAPQPPHIQFHTVYHPRQRVDMLRQMAQFMARRQMELDVDACLGAPCDMMRAAR